MFSFKPACLPEIACDLNVYQANHTTATPTAAVGLELSIDVPSKATGTGEALLLDGQDAAMLRLSVVDSHGRLVSGMREYNVSFSIVAGPGRVIGVGNGNPVSHERNKATWRSTYHGLARVIIQTTINAASTDRARLAEIDVDGGVRTRIVTGGQDSLAASAEDIVVQAEVSGFEPVRASIPVSVDAAAHGVNAVAARSVSIDLQLP